jgi:ferric-dicitrate binding protein FerR (iron transport regulator)
VSGLEQATPARRRGGRRRRTWLRVLALVVGAVLVFGLGVALGQALDDGPPAASTQTFVRTLQPLPQEPAATGP